jgi:hypothetical protein
MRWVLELVGTGIDGPSISVNIMEFDRPDCVEDITSLGLTLAEGKRLLALVQQEIVAAQVGNHAVLRPACRTCNGRCHVNDWRLHRIAILRFSRRQASPKLRSGRSGLVVMTDIVNAGENGAAGVDAFAANVLRSFGRTGRAV